MRDRGSSQPPPALPRWVKVFAIVAGVVVLLFVVLLVLGGHGPSRHSAGVYARSLAAAQPA